MEYLRSRKKWLIIGLTAVCLALMLYTGRQNYQPGPIERGFGFVVTTVQGFFMGIGDWFGDQLGFLVDMRNLHNENESLREELMHLQIENSRLTHVDAENQELVQLLNIFRKYSDYPTIGAKVISHDPNNWFSTVIIDRGSRDGVQPNMVVLAPGGLAGKILKVGINYSVVSVLIEDDGAAVSAETRRTRDWGVVRGDVALMADGLLRMDFIDPAADMAPGDEVVTSNIASIYPPGIHIGYITEMGQHPGGARYAIIRPSANFVRPEFVLVITELFEHVRISE